MIDESNEKHPIALKLIIVIYKSISTQLLWPFTGGTRGPTNNKFPTFGY